MTNKDTLKNNEISIICLTPVRNNIYLIERFLKAASLWADYIIIADQMSTDGTREIAAKHPKVILVDNNSETYNESVRQKLLINEARKIKGQKLLIALDVDELFTPNILTSIEWQTILNSTPGTIFEFQWANFFPDSQKMWLSYHFPWGYMDDGYEHNSNKNIHSGRIPIPSNHNILRLNQIKVIHFQYTDWEKMLIKQYYYQCIEKISFPDKSAVKIFRDYHHMFAISESRILNIPDDWIQKYNDLGIDITSVTIETLHWFEEQCLNFFEKYGADYFKRLNIWSIDWEERAGLFNRNNIELYKDPRSKIDKRIHNWLMKTQPKLSKRKYRRIDKLIKLVLRY